MRTYKIIFLTVIVIFLATAVLFAKEDKNQINAILKNAELMQKEGKINDAISECLKIIKMDAGFSPAYDRLACLYLIAGNDSEAEKTARAAISINRKNSVSNNVLGMINERRNDLKIAMEYYFAAIKNDPGYSKAYNNLANIYVKTNDFKNAEKTYKKALEIDPGLAMAHNNLGYLLEMQGKLKEAEERYNKALLIEPDFDMAENNLKRLKQKLADSVTASKSKEIAESICFYKLPEGFILSKAFLPENGGKLAVFVYKNFQTLLLRELPDDNKINETLFAQMIVNYKNELLKLLEDFLEIKNIKIVGQGYVDVDKRKVLYVSTEFMSEGKAVDGMFSVVTSLDGKKSVLILSLAEKGFYRREISENFLKTIKLDEKR